MLAKTMKLSSPLKISLDGTNLQFPKNGFFCEFNSTLECENPLSPNPKQTAALEEMSNGSNIFSNFTRDALSPFYVGGSQKLP